MSIGKVLLRSLSLSTAANAMSEFRRENVNDIQFVRERIPDAEQGDCMKHTENACSSHGKEGSGHAEKGGTFGCHHY